MPARFLLPLAVVGLALPWLISPFWVFVAVEMLVFGLYALSFNLLLGYGGMLAFGHAAFFGLGAYAVALLMKKAGVAMPLALAAAPLVAALAACVIAYFCVRLTGIYFGMLTFTFQMLIYTVAFKSYAFTGGDDGISGLRAPGVLGDPRGYYYFTVVVVALAVAGVHRLVHSPFGVTLRAIRANAVRTQYVGVNVTLHRWLTFVVAAGFAGLAGGLFALASGSVFPGWLAWTASAVPIIMAILGGLHTFGGPMVGAVVYVLLETVITGYTEYWAIVMGTIIVTLVVALPTGLTSLWLPGGRR